MKVSRLDDMIRGWFVGAFEPTAAATSEVEVGIKKYAAGDFEPAHHHKVAVELTAVVSGSVRMMGREFTAGDIIRLEPGESTDFLALADSVTVVVKLPCVAGDKYLEPT